MSASESVSRFRRFRVLLVVGSAGMIVSLAAGWVFFSGPPSEFEVAEQMLRELGPEFGVEFPENEDPSAIEIFNKFARGLLAKSQLPGELTIGGWGIVFVKVAPGEIFMNPSDAVWIEGYQETWSTMRPGEHKEVRILAVPRTIAARLRARFLDDEEKDLAP